MDEEVIIRLFTVGMLLLVVSVLAILAGHFKAGYYRYRIERRHHLKMKALAKGHDTAAL